MQSITATKAGCAHMHTQAVPYILTAVIAIVAASGVRLCQLYDVLLEPAIDHTTKFTRSP
eukprot:17845-Heterococcus_DN1.PRE.9